MPTCLSTCLLDATRPPHGVNQVVEKQKKNGRTKKMERGWKAAALQKLVQNKETSEKKDFFPGREGYNACKKQLQGPKPQGKVMEFSLLRC